MATDPKGDIGSDVMGIGKIGVQLIQTADKYLEMIFGAFLREKGELIADPVRRRRANLAAIAALAVEEVGNREMKQIPGRILFPLADAAMNEDDTDMQKMWASLLATALTAPETVPPAFPRILADLSPADVRILDWLYRNSQPRVDSVHPEGLTIGRALKDTQVPAEVAMLVLANLERLSLVSSTFPLQEITSAQVLFNFTRFGEAFVQACQPASSNPRNR